MAHLTQSLHDLVVHLGYLGLFIVMALGNMGAPAGTEIIMPSAGALAAQGHLPSLPGIPGWVLAGTVGTLGEITGGSILYAIGYYGGIAFVKRYGKYVLFREHELARVHAFYERFGAPTVFWCRFVPFVRGVAAFPAGLSRMQKRYFVTYTALGSAIFCFGLAYVGDVAGHNVEALNAALHKAALLIVLVAIAAVVAAVVVFRARSRAKAKTRTTDPAV
jgi:membrane protein DedA with SNARE-associated domain